MRLLESWRLLQRLQASLKLVIPVALAADTARSIVFTYRLAQQRLQEWEQEDAEDTKQEVCRLLRTVLRRCAAQDRDFWPRGLAAASGDSDGSSAGDLASPPAAAAGELEREGDAACTPDVWSVLGLEAFPASTAPEVEPPTAMAASAAPSAADTQLTVRAAEEQLVRHEEQQRQEAEAAAAARQAAQGATLVVVTLREAMAQVAASLSRLQLPYATLMAQQAPAPGVVMHVTLADVASILAASRPARAAAAAGTSLGQGVLSAADAVHAGLLRSVPLPQLQLCRKSALRCAVDWRGVHWPGPPPEPLERQLSCHC